MSAENRPNNHKLIRILTAAGILGGTGAVVGGKVLLDELSKPKAAASAEFTPSPTSAVVINGERYVVAPTATAIPTETAAPPSPTATEKTAPTAIASATPPLPAKEAATKVPTAKPVDTATATSTATNTATVPATVTATVAAKVEKSPLPKYTAYLGESPDGAIVIASVPEANNQDRIYFYHPVRSPDGKSHGLDAKNAPAENIKGSTFQVNPKGIWRVTATLDETSGVITGTYGAYPNTKSDTKPTNEFDFRLRKTGTGRSNLVTTLKRAKAIAFDIANADPSSIGLDELKRWNIDLSNLPE